MRDRSESILRKREGSTKVQEATGKVQACPRVLLTAPSSGAGKTLVTCGILQALRMRGLDLVSFKCGPDYIDPMFHRTVIGNKSRNIDSFFMNEKQCRELLQKNASGADVCILEGAMGYYDGIGAVSERASSYDIARITGTPAVLIADCSGRSLSVLPLILGFVRYREDANIRGVILNRVSAGLYPKLKARIEAELPQVRVLGYVEKQRDLRLESRHLGLVLPEELPALRENLRTFAGALERTVDLDGLLELAGEAPAFEEEIPHAAMAHVHVPAVQEPSAKVRIALAQDAAFCFSYEENLDLLRALGAELIPFSPLRDTALPEHVQGLLLPGGYPELHAEALAQNAAMCAAIRRAVQNGLPTWAECGGYLYLAKELEDANGAVWPMCDVLPVRGFRTEALQRFGYVTLESRPQEDEGKPGGTLFPSSLGPIRGHEFHYYDTTDNGAACTAHKPSGNRQWDCVHQTRTLWAGFPHLYYPSNPAWAGAFVEACIQYGGAV